VDPLRRDTRPKAAPQTFSARRSGRGAVLPQPTPRMRTFARIAAAIASLTLAGCDVTEPSAEEQFVLYVAPHTVECTGMVVQQCMLTRQSPTAEWTYFYGGIDGFTYEPGFDWTLLVRTRTIENPPADGSSIEYRLLGVLDKIPASEAP
jgi:hypothetical protein